MAYHLAKRGSKMAEYLTGGPMAQQYKESQPRREDDDVDENIAKNAGKAAVASNTEDIDKLLDEIDDVLSENAEQFVTEFVQKGGQ